MRGYVYGDKDTTNKHKAKLKLTQVHPIESWQRFSGNKMAKEIIMNNLINDK